MIKRNQLLLLGGGLIAAAWCAVVVWAQSTQMTTIDLSDSPLMQTEQTRSILDYTIQCALPEGIQAFGNHNDRKYSFSGVMGIAPEWLGGPLPKAGQKAVTACLLARTNAFGVPVQISMRSPRGQLASLPMFQVNAQELRDYPLWEGAFFGNIFDASPTAYACQGDPNQEEVLRAANRVCTLPTGQTTSDGKPVSACGFVLLGPCKGVDVTEIGKNERDYMVHVYLPTPSN